MTTVVRVREPLQALSMSSQPESRRKSKRLAGTYYSAQRKQKHQSITDRHES